MQMQTKKANKQIGVVAGILEQNNQYLLCQRPKGKICENFWEFPGGKVEPGTDTVRCNLSRIIRRIKNNNQSPKNLFLVL